MDAENRKLAMSLLVCVLSPPDTEPSLTVPVQVRVATGVDVSVGKALSNGDAKTLGKQGDERQYILITPQVCRYSPPHSR